MSDYVIETKNLTKQYGTQMSVSDLNIHVKKGRIYGLLGRNGAGKTTTMKMLLGLTAPTSGEVEILGKNIRTNSKQVLPHIGSLIEAPGFYPNLTGTENLRIFAELRNIKNANAIKGALELVGLPYRDKKLFSQYSLGMKQRLAIALAVMHNPSILILDEPINGLDPIGIAEVRSFIRELCDAQGKTILISSHIRRKEEGFDFLPDLIAISCVKEKASVSASVTVEAVLCVPLFLYAAVSLIWMLELRSIQSAVRCGLQSAGKQVAESFAEIPVLNPISLHADLVNAVGKERMDRSMIVGGSGGVSCKRSWAIPGMGVLELTAEYEVELPVPVFHIPVLHYKEKMRMKTWTGYVKTYEAGIGDNELVYVTETGIVYHRNYQCTYLEPSVRSVAKTQLGELRNSSGGIYHLCERCGWMPGNDGNCYVTDYGDRYHTSLSCSGLKRKVYTVPLSEVKGKGACSKCGGK